MKRTRRAIAAAAAVTVAIGLAGCAAGAEPTTQSGDGADSTATLSLAVQSPPRSLDPVDLDAGQQAFVWSSIYDTLLYRDNEGVIQPNAASAWEWSEDGLTLTFTIREDMTFSNGDPVDAGAVKATLDRNKERTGQQQEKMQYVTAVEAPDAQTVVLTFSTHDPAFLFNMTQDGGAIAHPATVDDERTTTNPIGSGPYTLNTERSVNGSSYVLERRADYWNVDQYPFQTFTVKVLQDQTAQVNALRSGQVDVASVPANQVSSVEGNGIYTQFVPAISGAFINLADRGGVKEPALADVRVRQAINYALPREQMVEQLLFGAGQATDQLFNAKGSAYLEELEGYYDYDVDKARELLDEAGYADGFTLTMPSSPVSLNFEPTISQALADVGITVVWDAVPAGSANAAVATGQYPAFFATSAAVPPERETVRQLQSAAQNPFTWNDPELDELIAAANSELDDDKRAVIYQDINRWVTENALFAPLFYLGTTLGIKDGIERLGDGTTPFSTVRLYGVAG
ncbi:ABC transporter substrate-binding protein [Microbacterium radiodurans]|uniref:ABC transporter substrate-binding protein n=1 Tax=Microbacterium radiodurans TaxID=661398 RepID=A0A5J5IWA3_9MICO|nr:ABC transporter substrate-binding protein [Microbacterium radiodurans]KAA9089102.1 ABC transporter substrate-binding protein [Microbacterium radiodurans]